MVSTHSSNQNPIGRPRVLVVGNHCHDVLSLENGAVPVESLGGAAAFISNIFDGLGIPFHLVSKVGTDFRYPISPSHPPIAVSSSKTTLFHATFHKPSPESHPMRVLRRVAACDPITPADLPGDLLFEFGMAVGVAGEILPETLERMLEICGVVFADIQALIREFAEDGEVRHVALKETGFADLVGRMKGIKASTEEAGYLGVDEVAASGCCVVVTRGSEGCRVYSRGGDACIPPFAAVEVDPTGAGDSFLGGFVGGLVNGLCVPDAAMVGNLFGSLAVQQVGLCHYDRRFLESVKEELRLRREQYKNCEERLIFTEQGGLKQFHGSLLASIKVVPSQDNDNGESKNGSVSD